MSRGARGPPTGDRGPASPKAHRGGVPGAHCPGRQRGDRPSAKPPVERNFVGRRCSRDSCARGTDRRRETAACAMGKHRLNAGNGCRSQPPSANTARSDRPGLPRRRPRSRSRHHVGGAGRWPGGPHRASGDDARPATPPGVQAGPSSGPITQVRRLTGDWSRGEFVRAGQYGVECGNVAQATGITGTSKVKRAASRRRSLRGRSDGSSLPLL